jgi:hypothetical protein
LWWLAELIRPILLLSCDIGFNETRLYDEILQQITVLDGRALLDHESPQPLWLTPQVSGVCSQKVLNAWVERLVQDYQSKQTLNEEPNLDVMAGSTVENNQKLKIGIQSSEVASSQSKPIDHQSTTSEPEHADKLFPLTVSRPHKRVFKRFQYTLKRKSLEQALSQM